VNSKIVVQEQQEQNTNKKKLNLILKTHKK